MEKQLKALRIAMCIGIGANIVCGAAFVLERNFDAVVWICMASFWMLFDSVLLLENEHLRRDKRNLIQLVYGQHAFMKREIQKAREAQKGSEDDGKSQSHGS